MSTFRNPIPIEPSTKGRHNPVREQDTIRALAEVRQVLRRVQEFLAPFSKQSIRDLSGRRYEVLAYPAGQGRVSSESTSTHPFKVYQRVQPGTGENPVYQYGVEYNSSLYKSLRPNDKLTVTGLLDSSKTNGWFSLTTGGYIWLEVTFDQDANVVACEINNSDENNFNLTAEAWENNNGYVESFASSPFWHQTSRKLIAYTTSGTDGNPDLTQVMRTDQILRNANIDGRPARYPYSHEGGYPL